MADNGTLKLSVNAQQLLAQLRALDNVARGAAGGIGTMDAAFKHVNQTIGGMRVPTFNDFINETDQAAQKVADLQAEIELANSMALAGPQQRRDAYMSQDRDIPLEQREKQQKIDLARGGYKSNGDINPAFRRGKDSTATGDLKPLVINDDLIQANMELEERVEILAKLNNAAITLEKQTEKAEKYRKVEIRQFQEITKTNKATIKSELASARTRVKNNEELTRQQRDLIKAAKKAHRDKRRMSGEMRGFLELDIKMHQDRAAMLKRNTDKDVADTRKAVTEKERIQAEYWMAHKRYTEDRATQIERDLKASQKIDDQAAKDKVKQTELRAKQINQDFKDQERNRKQQETAAKRSSDEAIRDIKTRIKAGDNLEDHQIRRVLATQRQIKANKDLTAEERKLSSALNLAGNKMELMGNKVTLTNKHMADLKKTISQARNAVLVYSFALRPVIDILSRTVEAAVQYERAITGVTSVSQKFGVSNDKLKASINSLTADGLFKVTDATKALRNLLSTGIGLPKAIQLLNTFRDSAAFNRQGMLEYGEAIVGATDGFKNMLSRMVDNAGITKNLSNILEEQAEKEDRLVKSLSEKEKHLLMANGLIKEGNIFSGDASRLADTMSGQFDAMSVSIDRASRSFGEWLDRKGMVDGYTTAVTNLSLAIEGIFSDESPYAKMRKDLIALGESTDSQFMKTIRLAEAEHNIAKARNQINSNNIAVIAAGRESQYDETGIGKLAELTAHSMSTLMMQSVGQLDKIALKAQADIVDAHIKRLRDFQKGQAELLRQAITSGQYDGAELAVARGGYKDASEQVRIQIEPLIAIRAEMQKLMEDQRGFNELKLEAKDLTAQELRDGKAFVAMMTRRIEDRAKTKQPNKFDRERDAELSRFKALEEQIGKRTRLTEIQREALEKLLDVQKKLTIERVNDKEEAAKLEAIDKILANIEKRNIKSTVDKYQQAREKALFDLTKTAKDLGEYSDDPLFVTAIERAKEAYNATLAEIKVDEFEDKAKRIKKVMQGVARDMPNSESSRFDKERGQIEQRKKERLEILNSMPDDPDFKKNIDLLNTWFDSVMARIGTDEVEFKTKEMAKHFKAMFKEIDDSLSNDKKDTKLENKISDIKKLGNADVLGLSYEDDRAKEKAKGQSGRQSALNKLNEPIVKWNNRADEMRDQWLGAGNREIQALIQEQNDRRDNGEPDTPHSNLFGNMEIEGRINRQNSDLAEMDNGNIFGLQKQPLMTLDDVGKAPQQKSDKADYALFGGKDYVDEQKATLRKNLAEINEMESAAQKKHGDKLGFDKDALLKSADERRAAATLNFYTVLEEMASANQTRLDEIESIRSKVRTGGSFDEQRAQIQANMDSRLAVINKALEDELISLEKHQVMKKEIEDFGKRKQDDVTTSKTAAAVKGINDMSHAFNDVAIAARYAGDSGIKGLDDIAKKGSMVANSLANAATGISQISNNISMMGTMAGAGATLGGVGLVLGAGMALHQALKGDGKKDKKNSRNGEIGTTVSRGPQTVNINPTIVVEAEGDVLFSQDSIEVFRNRLIDEVQQAMEFNELSVDVRNV